MAVYELYGIEADTLDGAKTVVQQLLSLSFQERESAYHRGPYFAYGRAGEENFEIKLNVDPFEDVPNENDFPNIKFLLYVNNTTRSAELKASLSNSGAAFLLRHEDL